MGSYIFESTTDTCHRQPIIDNSIDMATATAAGKNAQPFPDGTKDYVPLRAGGAKKDTNKVHIADTPMTWSNWPQHINWLNTTLVIFVPLAGFISAYWVPLQLKTALWAVFYYVHTGLGITAGKSTPNEALYPKPGYHRSVTYNTRLPPTLVSLCLQGHYPSQDLSRCCRCWRRSGFHPMVVIWSSCSPPLYRYRQGPLLRSQGSHVFPHGLDDPQAEP